MPQPESSELESESPLQLSLESLELESPLHVSGPESSELEFPEHESSELESSELESPLHDSLLVASVGVGSPPHESLASKTATQLPSPRSDSPVASAEL